jgi:tRNA threonylcarbamoyl adenosine modification protein (Sua5/YciO/YrdC/YwlC family)
MSSVISVATGTSAETIADAVARAVECVQSGGLAVIPTDTSYAVIADAFHAQALDKLRAAKEYLSNVPLPIAAASIETIRGVANLSPLASDLARAFWPGSLTILTRSQSSLSWDVAGSDIALAVRVPNHDVAQAVLAGIGPTVMTGAQKAGAPAVLEIAQALASLGDAVDVYLDDGPLTTSQSSVVDCTGEHIRLVRTGALTLADLRQVMPIVIDATASN